MCELLNSFCIARQDQHLSVVDTGEKDLGFLRHQVVPNRQILEIASGDQSAAGNPPLLFNNQHPKDRAVPSSTPCY